MTTSPAVALLEPLRASPLILGDERQRRILGLTAAVTVDLDHRTLSLRRLGLVGRPDLSIREDGFTLPEAWKSSPRLRPG